MRFSIITPMYNANNFLHKCVCSVLNQKFEDFEWIIVDDGSTDSSYADCLKLVDKDPRVHLFYQENMGPGSARNKAICMSKGEYILYLDIDDWLEDDTLEIIEKYIVKYDFDIARFFIYDHAGDNVSINIRGISINEEMTYEDKMRWISQGSAPVEVVVKREVIWKNEIKFFEHPIEDNIVWLLCKCLAERAIQIPKALYHYRHNEKSTTFNEEITSKWILVSHKDVKQEFKKRKLLETYEDVISRHCLTDIKYYCSVQWGGDYQKGETFLKETYPRLYTQCNKHYLVWGSYSLRATVMNMVVDLSRVNHIQFGSISQFIKKDDSNVVDVKHTNSYREKMIKANIQHLINEEIYDFSEKYDYFIFDLLEERFGVCVDKYGHYYCNSDALKEAELTISGNKLQLYPVDVEQSYETIMQAVKKWADMLLRFIPSEKIVLVCNYMCENYGQFWEKKQFDDAEQIKEINSRLYQYYELVKEIMPGIHVIDISKNELFFTDETYKHGCYPEYTNIGWENRVAEKLMEKIK